MKDENAIAGISGGRTSAMMAFLIPRQTVLCFQNTGKEAGATYDFLQRLEDDLQRPLVRLEFRAPARGEPPKKATFEIVKHSSLSRRGEPFMDMLECLRTYRAKHKNAGPVAPWARSRICTAYLKIKTQRAYTASLGWGAPQDYTEYVGLRADEPSRVARMRGRNDSRDTDERAPLHDRGITKSDVLAFWAKKPYDLGIPEYMGNCTGCFLKDERDLATALLQEESDARWWIDIEDTYGPMRRQRISYRGVLEEAPTRMHIRELIAAGTDDKSIRQTLRGVLPDRRLALLVRQERAAQATSFSCECDAAKDIEFEFDE
jgi:3'-phosphoadenosine 5'-phosphosulfate sulfotransferase (PAPS reductase)/FAD synthetase